MRFFVLTQVILICLMIYNAGARMAQTTGAHPRSLLVSAGYEQITKEYIRRKRRESIGRCLETTCLAWGVLTGLPGVLAGDGCFFG